MNAVETARPAALTKSRFKLALECPRKLDYERDPSYYSARREDEFLAALAAGGHQVGALARCLHPGGVLISGPSVEEQLAQTHALLQRDEATLFEGAVAHGNLLIRADILIKRGGELKLIEVKAKVFDPAEGFVGSRGKIRAQWRPYLYDLAFQQYVLEQAYPGWAIKPCLMLLDRRGRAPVDGLNALLSTDDGEIASMTLPASVETAALQPLMSRHDVAAEVAALRAEPLETASGVVDFRTFVRQMESGLAAGAGFPAAVGAQCKGCEYHADVAALPPGQQDGWADCMRRQFGEAAPDRRAESVFALFRNRGVAEHLSRGHLRLSDLREADFDRPGQGVLSASDRQRLQVQEAQGRLAGPVLLRDTVAQALDRWRYPLHFIDFETAQPAIPHHAGRAPSDQLLFQFSHHRVDADGRIVHADQLLCGEPGVPPSPRVVQALGACLGTDEGTVLHWYPHERQVLMEIRGQLLADGAADASELAAFVDRLTGTDGRDGRLVDLGRLVEQSVYYPGSAGRSSIKVLLPAVLRHSRFLRERYGAPVYGTPAMPSLNFAPGWQWVRERDGVPMDPYALLDPLLGAGALEQTIDALEIAEGAAAGEFVANGGAAMIAYGRLQQPKLPGPERARLVGQLLRYCELDTLAMVMVYEALRHELGH